SLAAAHPDVTFDIVDTPDYSQNGIFMGHALRHHSIAYGRVILALHGLISDSVRTNWPVSTSKKALSKRIAKLRILENLQYQVVDHRYAISERYAARWDTKFRNLSCSI